MKKLIIKFTPDATIETEEGVEVSVGSVWSSDLVQGTPAGVVTVSGILVLRDKVGVTLKEKTQFGAVEINFFAKNFTKEPF
jgi:hypothetical protein